MKKFSFLLVILLCLQAVFLTGCWDSHELDKLFLVTGMGIDYADEQNTELTVQVAKTQNSGKEGGSQGPTPLNFSQTDNSVLPSFIRIAQSSGRIAILEHNQVILFGEQAAKKGIKDHLDFFSRIEEARIEVPVLIIKGGTAKQVLNTSYGENKLSSTYCSQLSDTMVSLSKHTKMRVIDMMMRMLCDNYACAVPAFEQKQEPDGPILEFAGMAVLKQGILQDYLDYEQTLAYLIVLGDVKNWVLNVQNEQGKANFRFEKVQTKNKIKQKDGQFEVDIKIETSLEIEEIVGFEKTKPEELIKQFEKLIEEKIKQTITQTMQFTQTLKSDVFGFGNSIHKKQPKIWKQIRDDWDEIFSNLKTNIQVKAKIPSVGDIVPSIDMEKNIKRSEE